MIRLEEEVLTFGELVTSHGFLVIMSTILITGVAIGGAILFLLHILGGGKRGE